MEDEVGNKSDLTYIFYPFGEKTANGTAGDKSINISIGKYNASGFQVGDNNIF